MYENPSAVSVDRQRITPSVGVAALDDEAIKDGKLVCPASGDHVKTILVYELAERWNIVTSKVAAQDCSVLYKISSAPRRFRAAESPV